jgi:hypothetical protein
MKMQESAKRRFFFFCHDSGGKPIFFPAPEGKPARRDGSFSKQAAFLENSPFHPSCIPLTLENKGY